jgi:hypothetical protein
MPLSHRLDIPHTAQKDSNTTRDKALRAEVIRMSIRHNIDAKTLGKRYAAIVRQRQLPVQGVWVTENQGYPVLWILAEHLDDLDALKPTLRALTDLQREYPDLLFDHRLLNPSWTPDRDLMTDVPESATRIELTE